VRGHRIRGRADFANAGFAVAHIQRRKEAFINEFGP
jgi:hypothetical protein